MDGDRFDHFTRLLAVAGSRRALIRVASVGLSGFAGLAGIGLDSVHDAEARRRKRRRKKKNKKKRCKGKNKKKCNGTCVKIKKDPQNCGGCGNVCPDEAPSCKKGSCTCRRECCADEHCPPGADVTCDSQSGTCGCENLGNCCFDSDCPAPNQACLSVNNVNNCFCKPELVCGPVGNRVCCEANETCNQQTQQCE